MVSNMKIDRIEEVLKVDGKVLDQKVTKLVPAGENFSGLMLKLDVDIEKNDKHTETLHLVAKRLLVSERVLEMNMFAMGIEYGFYSDIRPVFESFVNAHALNEDLFCKIYGMRYDKDQPKDFVILMENLVANDYKNVDRHVGFDLELSKLILKKLAVFHAIFMGIKAEDPAKFESKIKASVRSGSKMGGMHTKRPGGPPPGKGPKKFGGLLENPTFMKALEENQEAAKYLPQLQAMPTPSGGPFAEVKGVPEKWKTVTHSDFWVNNIMINLEKKYEEQVKFVDFQMIQYGCFVRDLLFFLFTSVKTSVQKAHFDDLLSYYHQELSRSLKTLHMDAPSSEEYKDLFKLNCQAEFNHAQGLIFVVLGEKNLKEDPTMDPNFDPFMFLGHHKKITPLITDKLLMMIRLAGDRGWLET